jgi:hypothetical protein
MEHNRDVHIDCPCGVCRPAGQTNSPVIRLIPRLLRKDPDRSRPNPLLHRKELSSTPA